MEIRSDVRERIKTDSVPAIRTQGMLGDRYIDISMGTETAPSLPEGAPLVGEAATDFDKTLRQATEVLDETEKLLTAVNEQRGTAGQLVYDEKLYTSLTEITTELKDLIQDFKKNPRRYIKFSLF
jgi:ABC-type transporter Mla subunit MlaD